MRFDLVLLTVMIIWTASSSIYYDFFAKDRLQASYWIAWLGVYLALAAILK